MGRREHEPPSEPAGTLSQRVDKWLWHARIVKTRSLAAEIVEAGKVRRNRERLTKSSDQVKLHDVLTITLPSRVIVLRVMGFAERRGGPAEAAGLCEDVAQSTLLSVTYTTGNIVENNDLKNI
jgi:ribosome-associated heat shock protein Hsp15